MQINRLFEIIYLLLNKDVMTAKALADRFEVSPRTIYRDVELLSSAGIPVYMSRGKGGGISLLADFVLNKTMLTDEEKADILSALHAVKAISFERSGATAQKLSALFGNAGADWVEVDFSCWVNAEEEAQLFNMLKTAIIEKKKASFSYHSSKGNVQRTVEPLKLCFKGQSWYLYAFCALRQDMRFFKLRRIKELELLCESFDRGAPANIFELKGSKTFQDDFVTITLKLSEKMAYRVYDEFSQFEALEDGGFIARLSMPRGDWVYQYLASFGENCEILGPEDIRQQVKKKLQKTLAQYL